jgi:hypothetical protein
MAPRAGELQPELREAQEVLGRTLKEACAMDPAKANTGELIHIDELLAIAGESAKKAISVRRRLRKDSGKSRTSTQAGSASVQTITSAHRVFVDGNQVRWTTFAVHPSKPVGDRPRLPGPFQTGWLSFDSGAETRRLTPIPNGWNELSDEELSRLCEQAKVASRRGKKGK